MNSEKSSTLFHGIYLFVITGVLLAFTVISLFFTRPVESPIEKRALSEFPHYKFSALLFGEYMDDLSQWFNETEPYREYYTGLFGEIRSAMRFKPSKGDTVSVILSPTPTSRYNDNDDEPMRKAQRGILLVGRDENLRAMVTYSGVDGGDQYAEIVNKYAKKLPFVSVYSMIVPTATDFYLPTNAQQVSKPQISTIDNVHSKLSKSVTDVNVYKLLKSHRNEKIYLRTDHHWAPLGAYYAAQAFAHRAEVNFKELSGNAYIRHEIQGFVGSMHHYSGDEAVKSAPEDFVYWTPAQVEYTTLCKQYKVDKNENIVGQTPLFETSFFKTFRDGSTQAYLTFMGSDRLLNIVKTSTETSRRLLIIKDSFGNAIPGYLFYSFSEIHIVDFRYFPGNLASYCAKNGITDLLFVFNVFNVYNPQTAKKLNKLLRQ